MPDRPRWLDDARRPPASVPASAHRPAPLLLDDEHRPITTAAAWKARNEQHRERWTKFLGTIPPHPEPPRLKVLESDERDGVSRQLVRYESEPGLEVEGYLLRPPGELPKARTRPGAVVFHSTTDATIRQPAGLDGPADKFIGLHLARRGYVAFCPRCYLWQYSAGGKIIQAVDWLRKRHPGVTGMAKMLADAVRAIDVLLSQPDVDPGRVGSIGHSLGAKEVLYLSAFDPRVRATVSSEGGVSIGQSNWEAPWYLGESAKRPGFPLDHAQILGMSAPRAFFLLGGNSADGDASWPTVEAALPVWELLGARDALGVFNHGGGHAYPPEASRRAYEWLDWFLRADLSK
ncbi:MAG: dienelactone hydrolase family protein [Isosphaeraceae bacterium]